MAAGGKRRHARGVAMGCFAVLSGWFVSERPCGPAPTVGLSSAMAYAERFVRSVKEECLDRIIPFGEGHFRRAVSEFIAHYHRERNHQGLENALLDGAQVGTAGRVHRQSRLGGLL